MSNVMIKDLPNNDKPRERLIELGERNVSNEDLISIILGTGTKNLNVREDAMLSFGFLTEEDKKIFKMLLAVNGIGPKGALAILSALTPDELRFAVLAGDDKSITKAQGIGKKMAQKLIIELKDKLNFEEAIELSYQHNATSLIASNEKNDAISALVSLGYSSAESMQAVNQVEITDDMSV